MERIILAAAALAGLAFPALATPYHEFVDLTRRDTVGTAVIRAFPDAANPSFTLLLERRSAEKCIVWLEFVPRGHPIDHYDQYGKRTDGNRRALVKGPLFEAEDSIDESGIFVREVPFLENLHWVARGTNDALHLVRVEVGADEDGACVAGTHVRFTPNLAYRDVVDGKQLTTYGEARVRGFPGDDPTFTLFVEYLEAGTVLEQGGRTKTLSGDVCALSLEIGPEADPYWTPDLIARFDALTDTLPRRFYLIASGPGATNPTSEGVFLEQAGTSDPWISHNTGEIFRIVDASLSGPGCQAKARVQWAPRMEDFYR